MGGFQKLNRTPELGDWVGHEPWTRSWWGGALTSSFPLPLQEGGVVAGSPVASGGGGGTGGPAAARGPGRQARRLPGPVGAGAARAGADGEGPARATRPGRRTVHLVRAKAQGGAVGGRGLQAGQSARPERSREE